MTTKGPMVSAVIRLHMASVQLDGGEDGSGKGFVLELSMDDAWRLYGELRACLEPQGLSGPVWPADSGACRWEGPRPLQIYCGDAYNNVRADTQ